MVRAALWGFGMAEGGRDGWICGGPRDSKLLLADSGTLFRSWGECNVWRRGLGTFGADASANWFRRKMCWARVFTVIQIRASSSTRSASALLCRGFCFTLCYHLVSVSAKKLCVGGLVPGACSSYSSASWASAMRCERSMWSCGFWDHGRWISNKGCLVGAGVGWCRVAWPRDDACMKWYA